jgi:ADP-ribose pyrophosphatase YjhB (NUDIX family)
MTETRPEIQLISNLIVHDGAGRVLMVRYHRDDERWWLPGEDLEPYQHPDELARSILDGLPGLTYQEPVMAFVESFRGRRGWHVVFHYVVRGEGDPGGRFPASWFPADDLPRTMHGSWERDAVRRALSSPAYS